MSRVSSLANLTPLETSNSFLGVANFGKLTSVERGSGECSQSHSINPKRHCSDHPIVSQIVSANC